MNDINEDQFSKAFASIEIIDARRRVKGGQMTTRAHRSEGADCGSWRQGPPPDEQTVLAWVDGDVSIGRVVVPEDDAPKYWFDGGYGLAAAAVPTWWMPLPQPPPLSEDT